MPQIQFTKSVLTHGLLMIAVRSEKQNKATNNNSGVFGELQQRGKLNKYLQAENYFSDVSDT